MIPVSCITPVCQGLIFIKPKLNNFVKTIDNLGHY